MILTVNWVLSVALMKVTASQVSYDRQYIESGGIFFDIIICEGQLFFNSFSECNNWHQNGIPCPDGKYCVDKHCIGNFNKGCP